MKCVIAAAAAADADKPCHAVLCNQRHCNHLLPWHTLQLCHHHHHNHLNTCTLLPVLPASMMTAKFQLTDVCKQTQQ
jgi:hypothetical protein